MGKSNVVMLVGLLLFFMVMSVVIAYFALSERPEPKVVIKHPVIRTTYIKYDIQIADIKTKIKSVSIKTKSVSKKEIKKPVPKPEPKIDDETYLLAQIIHAEAKGEPYEGKLAVGNVIINRKNSDQFPDTIKGVIFQKGQFQPVSNGSIYNKPGSEALQAAKEVMNGKRVVGNQALYFYNPAISTSDWIFSRKTLTTIGNHRFAY